MSAAIVSARGLTRRFGDVSAVDGVTFELGSDRIYGLLGRNGAGKTTLMHLLTGQDFPTAGTVEVFGRAPAEHAGVLQRICFIKESQRYPEDFRVKHVLRSAPWFFERWDADFAAELVEAFELPLERRVKKLSRGQLSAVGVIVGLASRAPLTFFDEPYLGLDAVARQIFYDRLLADYAEHPRTVVLSTHLIDEVADLLEHVLLIDHGRIVLDRDADELRAAATTVAGPRVLVEEIVGGHDVLRRDGMGGIASVTVAGFDDEDRKRAAAAGLDLAPVSLQQLVVGLTNSTAKEFV